MTPDDLPLFKGWLRTPHVARWYHDVDDWIAEAEDVDGTFGWLRHFISEQDGRPVGFCQYYAGRDSGEEWLDALGTDGTYSLDYLIGDVKDLRRGFGRQLVGLLTEEIAQNPDAMRIAARPEPENEASRALLRSCGFKSADADACIFVKELEP